MFYKTIVVQADDGMTSVIQFGLGQRVRVDGSGGITGIVTGVCIYPHAAQFQVSWWNNGEVHETWFQYWRLEAVE